MPDNKQLSKLSLKELQQKAQEIYEEIKSTQDKLANISVIGVAGNKDVQVKINGQYQVISTTIKDDAFTNKEKLTDLITIAINDALSQLEVIAKG